MNKQFTIPCDRWEELINKVSTELWISGVPVEEINIIVSVLKNNTPFNVVDINTPFEVVIDGMNSGKSDLSFVEYCDLNK